MPIVHRLFKEIENEIILPNSACGQLRFSHPEPWSVKGAWGHGHEASALKHEARVRLEAGDVSVAKV